MSLCNNYFGSADSGLIARDFSDEERRNFTIRREILWESKTATPTALSAKEVEFIRQYRSSESGIGYNRWPRYARR